MRISADINRDLRVTAPASTGQHAVELSGSSYLTYDELRGLVDVLTAILRAAPSRDNAVRYRIGPYL